MITEKEKKRERRLQLIPMPLGPRILSNKKNILMS